MDNNHIILDLCSGTGAWSLPYRQAGYDVIELDIKNDNDVRLFVVPKKPEKNVIGVLASPPCTHLARSGAKYWKEKGDKPLLEALSIVDACLRIVMVTKPEWWALENPIGRLSRYLGKPKLIFNPCDYGNPYTKRTCLWGDFNIPEKNPVEPIKECSQGSWIQKLGGKSERTKTLRSITPSGFARALFEAIGDRMKLFDLWKLSVICITILGGILGYLWIREAYFPIEIKIFVVIWLSLGFFYFYIQSWRLVIWISEITKSGDVNK